MRKIELLFEEKDNYFMREAFNTLRTNILFSGKNIKSIVVTSCEAHEGKSTVSFELCRCLAESGKRVLLIDADLRASTMVASHTKARGLMGLSQVLSGQVEYTDAVYATQVEDFHIMFAGPFPPNPAELVGSPAFKDLTDANRSQYDYIIIDAPPLGLVIDAALMASTCDGSILVVSTGKIRYRFAQTVKEQLEKSGSKILGVVLNQTERNRSISSKSIRYYNQH